MILTFLKFKLHTYKNIQAQTSTTDKFRIGSESHATKFSEYHSFLANKIFY